MELIVNDLSVAGQFLDIPTFKDSIERVMLMRILAKKFGRELYCHRNMLYANIIGDLKMQQVIQNFTHAQQRDIIGWITKHGPFWDDARHHSGDDYLECDGDIVTDTAVGEAAWCCMNGLERRLVSFIPSKWEGSPVPVTWRIDTGSLRCINLINHCKIDDLEIALKAAPQQIMTWEQLASVSNTRFPHLTFASDCFYSLQGHPFVEGASTRIMLLLGILRTAEVQY